MTRRRWFGRIEQWLIDALPTLSPTELRILIYVLHAAGPRGAFEVTQSVLAKAIGSDRTQVWRALQTLKGRTPVRIVRSQHATVFYIPTDAESATPDVADNAQPMLQEEHVGVAEDARQMLRVREAYPYTEKNPDKKIHPDPERRNGDVQSPTSAVPRSQPAPQSNRKKRKRAEPQLTLTPPEGGAPP